MRCAGASPLRCDTGSIDAAAGKPPHILSTETHKQSTPIGQDMARGRPTAYNDKVVKEILERLAEGQSLRSICADEHMPAESTVRAWALDDYKGFSAQYTRAREIGYLSMADELLDVSDDARNDWMERRGEEDAGWVANGEHIQRSRLRVDTRKWLLSKTLPKIYGDKLTHQGTGEGGEFVFKFSFE